MFFLAISCNFFFIPLSLTPFRGVNWKLKMKTKQNISILVVLLYSWQINVNTKKFQVLGDVYYGVQIAYLAIIGSQLSILVLSIVLIAGINSVSAASFNGMSTSFASKQLKLLTRAGDTAKANIFH
jgi:hypothetical protein